MKKRVMGVVLVLALVAMACVFPASADPLTLSAVDFFMSGWATYAASHGLDMTLVNNGVNASPSAPMSSASVSSLASDLWAEYNAVTQDYQNIDAWLNAFQNGLSYVPSQSGTNVAFTMARELTGWYDEFANWILTQKYNCTPTESGYSHSSGTFDSPLVSIVHNMSTDFLPVSKSSSDRTPICVYTSNNQMRSVYAYADADVFIAFVGINGADASWIYVSASRSSVIQYYSGNSYSTVQLENSSDGVFYVVKSYGANANYNPLIPRFGSTADALAVAKSYLVDGDTTDQRIQLRPEDKYNERPIPVPDTTAQGYESDVLTGDWAIAGSENMTLADALDALLARVQANQGVLAAEGTGGEGGGDDNGNSGDPDDYQSLGLADVFPFCLPFDLYAFFSCLAADPVAPRFEIPINFPHLLEYTFVIDLAPFATVAQILRTMELLAFCVGLILITRDKMIRG